MANRACRSISAERVPLRDHDCRCVSKDYSTLEESSVVKNVIRHYDAER
jgi:hypothetical protein